MDTFEWRTVLQPWLEKKELDAITFSPEEYLRGWKSVCWYAGKREQKGEDWAKGNAKGLVFVLVAYAYALPLDDYQRGRVDAFLAGLGL